MVDESVYLRIFLISATLPPQVCCIIVTIAADWSHNVHSENYGELEEMCTVHSTTLLSESALQELSDVASDLESGIMNASDFSVQSKFTFSRLVKLQQTLAGSCAYTCSKSTNPPMRTT